MIEIFQRHDALAGKSAQHDLAAQRNQPRHRVADGRTIGDIAAQGAGIADRQGSKALPQFRQLVWIVLAQRRIGLVQAGAGANLQLAVNDGDAFQRGHITQINNVAQVAQLLGHPQANVGGAGQQARLRLCRAQCHQFIDAAWRVEVLAAVLIGAQAGALQPLQLLRQGIAVECDTRQFAHASGRIDDGPVAGAAAQIARQAVVDFAARGRLAVFLQIHAPQRHDKAGRAKAALGTVAFDHRLLHRVQGAIGLLQVFHGKQGLAVEGGRELDAGVDGLHLDLAIHQAADDHRASAAIAFRAALLGARAMQVLAQVLQHSLRRGGVAYFLYGTTIIKADRF